jgi:hypothetical protein
MLFLVIVMRVKFNRSWIFNRCTMEKIAPLLPSRINTVGVIAKDNRPLA